MNASIGFFTQLVSRTAGGSFLTGFSNGQRQSVELTSLDGGKPRIHPAIRLISASDSDLPMGILGASSPFRMRMSGL